MSNLAGNTDKHIGNYRLKHLLGRGGFAEVYLAEHIYLKTLVAIKILHTQLVPEDQENFLTEARTIAHLKHPHILPVLEFGVEKGTPFLVMDYASNGSLRECYPKGNHSTPFAVLPAIKQVASALQYAHQANIVHRDVKPENILLGAQHEVYLSDFGIALGMQSSRAQNMQEVAGTVTYMAPELLQGKPCPASDQYSLGIVLYELLSGDCPFHGSFTEIASQHVLATPPAIKTPAVSPEVEAVIIKALAKTPEQRFDTIRAFVSAFEQASMDVGGTFRAQLDWHLPAVVYQPNQAATPKQQPRVPETPPITKLPTATAKAQHPKKPSRGLAILLSIVALLVISSGLILVLRFNTAQAQNTAQVQGTTQAQDTITTWQNKYIQVTSTQPLLADPLTKNVNRWDAGANSSCAFTKEAYHEITTTPYTTKLCSTPIINNLSNLAYQVQMTILQGNEGGMFFRLHLSPQTHQPQAYFFSIDRNGTYTLWATDNQRFTILHHRSSITIKTGFNQSNLLGIIAQGQQIALYINKHYIDSFVDNSASSGSIGLFCQSLSGTTEVAFSRVQVWRV